MNEMTQLEFDFGTFDDGWEGWGPTPRDRLKYIQSRAAYRAWARRNPDAAFDILMRREMTKRKAGSFPLCVDPGPDGWM